MLTYTDLPLIPTQVIGSHGIPGWIWVVRDAIAEGKMGPADVDEALKDAVKLAIMDMEEAGVDIIPLEAIVDERGLHIGRRLPVEFTWANGWGQISWPPDEQA